jgi:hypothetical protein
LTVTSWSRSALLSLTAQLIQFAIALLKLRFDHLRCMRRRVSDSLFNRRFVDRFAVSFSRRSPSRPSSTRTATRGGLD